MANRRHLAKLKEGKDAWNQWRAANPTVKPDLRGANLRGKHLEEFDFSHADIRGTNFKAAHLILPMQYSKIPISEQKV